MSINFKIIALSAFLIGFLAVPNASSQNSQETQDSILIEKIKNIDVSLNSIDENDENLFLNNVSFEDFYDELSPDGEWIQITKEEIEKDLKDGEGQSVSSFLDPDVDLYFIWHPTTMEDNWAPYTNGRWVWTTDGWMWASDYSWGWAVYHYGRWWNSPKYGWVWMPGYVWAPAWVQWRITENHIGWCPLTPNARWNSENGITTRNYSYRNRDNDWVFVEKSRFADDIGRSNIVSASENRGLIAKSNSVLNLKPDGSRIFNNGPDVNDIETRTGKSFKQRIINFMQSRGKTLLGDNNISIFKPKLKQMDVTNKGNTGTSNEPKKYKMTKKVKKLKKLGAIRQKIIMHRKP